MMDWKIKYLCGLAICLLLVGCSGENTQTHLQIIESITSLQNNQGQNADSETIKVAKALLAQADSAGYTLITPNELHAQMKDFKLIATLPRGIYNLGLIPNAMNFDPQATNPSRNTGTSQVRESESTQDSEQFSLDYLHHLLGHNKQAKILIYDEGTSESSALPLSPSQSASHAIGLARKLGYVNVYYLVGGFKMWKELKLPVSTEIPSCCQM